MNETSPIDFGPLGLLLGTWRGNKGLDVSPEPDGDDENPYYETIVFSPVEDVIENAEEQELVAVHYRQIVQRKRNDKVFHDETGYWMWEPKTGLIMHSLVIPRGMGLLAGGNCESWTADASSISLSVKAGEDDPTWPIMQSPFMATKAQTQSFTHTLSIDEDRMHYKEIMQIEIYGKSFEHTDENHLVKVA